MIKTWYVLQSVLVNDILFKLESFDGKFYGGGIIFKYRFMENLHGAIPSSHGKVKLFVGLIVILVVLALFYFFGGGGEFFQGKIGKMKIDTKPGSKQEMQGLIPIPSQSGGGDAGSASKTSNKQGSKQEMQGLIPIPSSGQ